MWIEVAQCSLSLSLSQSMVFIQAENQDQLTERHKRIDKMADREPTVKQEGMRNSKSMY